MNWAIWVIVGAAVNACINYGYKVYGSRLNMIYLVAAVMAVGAVGSIAYAVNSVGLPSVDLMTGRIVGTILAMGVGMAVVWVLMVTALTCGPISLVDPLWACLYALISVLVGMGFAGEAPKLISLLGVLLYLVGVVLIARGAKK